MKRMMSCLLLALLCVTGVSAAKKVKDNGVVSFTHYGTDVSVRMGNLKKVKVKKATDEEITNCLNLIEAATQETLEDCQRQKQEQGLCDWAYLKMLDRVATTRLGNTNEATLLLASLLGRSGYGTKLTRSQDGLIKMLYLSNAHIFGREYFYIDGKSYYIYADGKKMLAADLKIVESFQYQGRPIDPRQPQDFKAEQLTAPRTIKSLKNPDFTFTVQVNKNVVDFYNDLPTFSYDDNFMTRWSTMANRPLTHPLQQTLVEPMKKKLAGKSQQDQVQQILWWAQGTLYDPNKENKDCFLYQYDEEVWGYDRAFYCEETLFYPYGDSEDRSILFSRLVRDVVGLDVLLIYYSNHLATAVCITDADVPGAYVVHQGRHFVICDPTYIGSDVGEEMPNMKGLERTVILLEQ